MSPWAFFKGQFQYQCRIGALARPGSNPAYWSRSLVVTVNHIVLGEGAILINGVKWCFDGNKILVKVEYIDCPLDPMKTGQD